MKVDNSRRSFLGRSVAGLSAVALTESVTDVFAYSQEQTKRATPPLAVSSANGLAAVAKATEMMRGGADTLDAVIAGVNIVELDPKDNSVGYGGLPNERCEVELDSSVMHGPTRRAGAVASLKGVRTPSHLANAVTE
ncbi:MAG: isoaspartyl peptidase/L-asparaginase, partial [Pyrinomonadaceae bacterium]